MMKEDKAKFTQDRRYFCKSQVESYIDLLNRHSKYKIERETRKNKKSRFPFEVFSAGAVTQKKTVAVMPEDSAKRKLRKNSVNAERPYLRKTESIPELIGRGMLEEDDSKATRYYGRNVDAGFLPKIKGIANEKAGPFATLATSQKRKSLPEADSPYNMRKTPAPSLQFPSEHEIFQTQQERPRKESWSECQIANLDLLLGHTKRSGSGYLSENFKPKFPAGELETLQLPISGVEKIWRTLHTKLKPIDRQTNPEGVSTADESMRKTAYFNENLERTPKLTKVVIKNTQNFRIKAGERREEDVRTVNVTFGDHAAES
eukprot:TRINITY_DN4277_c1_g1_i1.p1 TRINITY_DN4277_c1_g1~~TRINITY_DN4277_c1_g1_i1.p1  ORF type:complete len:317 (+),score=40.04 TRINITY_DN4277_c1_g1_i1:308-1258(+)